MVGVSQKARSRSLATDEATSLRMSSQRSLGTKPELELRRLLHARGLRYRVNVAQPGMPRRRVDVVFSRVKVAVFVDGCFWHGCPQHATWPKRNSDWWAEKLTRNAQRDRETTEALEVQGWTVVRVWEHEDPKEAADRIESVVRGKSL
ncbi:MAG: very short patch repair endonuclease [Nocardioidaceae bacterium]|nr:very short patch repair endonuclease [Nocardioidaceae bacterium]